MTLHAEEEMDADGLSIFDVESVILTGRANERQRDREPDEWQYHVERTRPEGAAVHGSETIGRGL